MGLFQNIAKLIISPKVGWEDISVTHTPAGRVLAGAYYPLLAALAVSCFVAMLYDRTLTLSTTLMTAIILFSAYFVTYFITDYLLGGFYPELSKTEGSSQRLADFVAYCLIYLVLLVIIGNVLPIDFTPIFFLMIYVVWIVYRGSEFLGIKENKRWKFTLIASAMLLFIPLIIEWFLKLIIL